MLGDFITRSLVALLGYAYPAFECYKTVENNKVEIEQLHFWCQYWIIVAVLTVFERFCDVFVSWLPMYGEMKLAFVIYLWYPRTKGTTYVYETFLRPNVAKYETDIDRLLLEFKVKAWDLIVLHWQNCVGFGHSMFFQFLQYLAAHSGRARDNLSQQQERPPSAPSPPPKQTLDYMVTSSASKTVQLQDHLPPETVSKSSTRSRNSPDHRATAPESDIAEALRSAGTRLRRSRHSS